MENRTEASGIGFSATVKSKKQRSISEAFKVIEPEDLIKFGLIPELVGRLPVVAALDELTEDALIEILTQPRNAVVKQFSKLLALEGAELEVRPSALKAIARKALARKTGARGLRSILEQALIDTMFDLPSSQNVEKVVVDDSTIEDGKPRCWCIGKPPNRPECYRQDLNSHRERPAHVRTKNLAVHPCGFAVAAAAGRGGVPPHGDPLVCGTAKKHQSLGTGHGGRAAHHAGGSKSRSKRRAVRR